MFWLMAATLCVAFIFAFFLAALYVMDRNARQLIAQLPRNKEEVVSKNR